MTKQRALEIISNAQKSTVTIYFPLILSVENQPKVREHIETRYGNDILGISFGGKNEQDGDRLHLFVRKNYASFQTIRGYAQRVKTLASTGSTPKRHELFQDDDMEED